MFGSKIHNRVSPQVIAGSLAMTVARTGRRVTGAEVVVVMTAEAMTEVAAVAHPPVWGKSDHPRRYHCTLLKINNAHRPEN